jgi:hypothetical protein
VNDGGSIIPGILSIVERIRHHRLSQISVGISFPNSFVKSLFETPSFQMNILPQIHEKHRHTAILAEGDSLPPSDITVTEKVLENRYSQGRSLLLPPLFQSGNHILGKLKGRFQRKRTDRIPHPGNMDTPHTITFFL